MRRMGKETVEGKKDMGSSRGGGGWETLGGGGEERTSCYRGGREEAEEIVDIYLACICYLPRLPAGSMINTYQKLGKLQFEYHHTDPLQNFIGTIK